MSSEQSSRRIGALALGALGVVYGDIGTSPLYALRESFHNSGNHLEVSEANVLGVLSLVFWALIIIITIKYLAFVMRADNQGEGGILALTALITPSREPDSGGTVRRNAKVRTNGTEAMDGNGAAIGAHNEATQRRRKARARWALVLFGLFGTSLLYGDGMITPAISVLSAVEGTTIVTPRMHDFVVPIAVVILIALFVVQPRGTGAIGKVFGPVMVVWFAVLAVLGIANLVDAPEVLRAVNPSHGVAFFIENGFSGFLALGSVFLVVTGGEALYADMGHFGKKPIQLGWYAIVFPALLLNYLGQGALLLRDPEAIDNPFFRLAPEWALYPLVVLATVATVIASQALISGAFSLTRQATQLGYSPRVLIRHTSEHEAGQIYVPAVNWALMAACIALVFGFRSSANLAAAYGLAVTATMVITTILFFVVARDRFGWSPAAAGAASGVFLAIDLGFFGANVFKIPAGGWFPLVVGSAVFTVLTTWYRGRALVAERIRRGRVPLSLFVESVSKEHTERVDGTAIYLFGSAGLTPPALISNLRHNNALHEKVVCVAVVTDETPHVHPVKRAEVNDVGHGFFQVVLHFGFLEEPDVLKAIDDHVAHEIGFHLPTAAFFLGRETLRVTARPGMARWREHLFAFLSRNATPAANYFGLPLEQTMDVGIQVEL